MKAKRIISAFLVLALAASLTACSWTTEEASAETDGLVFETVAAGETAGAAPSIYSTEITNTQTEDGQITLPRSYEYNTGIASSSPEVADETVTLMIYIVGSTLESGTPEYNYFDSGAASADMFEIMASGVDTSRCNVLLFLGGSTSWDTNVPSDHNVICRLNGNTLEPVLSLDDNLNMGEAYTLEEFLRFGYNEFPADHYALILWDHGGGPNEGFGSDQNFLDAYGNGNVLYADELAEALEQSPFGGSVRFDWVGYDACLMDSIETAGLWVDYADYLIASEESEEGEGWDYSFLSILNETVDPVEIAAAVIDSFAEYYENAKSSRRNPIYTLSCLDLSQVTEVMDSLDALSSAMARDVSESYDNYKSFANIRSGMTRFGVGSYYSFEMVDLVDLSYRMSSLYPNLTADLSYSLSELVIYNRTNLEGAYGVSIYYPYEFKLGYILGENALYSTSGMPESYIEYLTDFSGYWAEDGAYSPLETDGEEVSDESEVVIQLSDEQLASLAGATYTVMIDVSSDLGGSDAEGLYAPVVLNRSIEPDENGRLHIPRDIDVIFFGDSETAPWVVQQISETDQYVDYITLDSYLGGVVALSNFDELDIQIRIRVYKEDGRLEIVSVSLADDDGNVGKSNISLEDFNSIARTVTGYVGEDYVPYTKWEKTNNSKDWFTYFSSSFPMSVGKSDTVVCPVVCQVLLEDVSGEISASKLIDLNWNERESIVVSTENGEMTFTNLGDSLLLSSYEGTDRELYIPSDVEGIPVTKINQKVFCQNEELQSVNIPGTVSEIGWKAFYDCENLETVVFNEGLETIREGAFTYCKNLTAINIPASVTEIGTAAFAGCYELLNFTISEGNQNYRMQDGLILSADGTVLVSYTAAALGDVDNYIIRVPDGVKEIADAAFAYCLYVDQIFLPDGLERIGNYAFYQAAWLEAPVFPDSLTSIGNYAFNMGSYEVRYNSAREDIELPDPMPIVIGANLLHINETAFSNDIYSEFIVDPDNPYYSSVDGDLANKAGDRIICRAYRGEDFQIQGTIREYKGMEFVCPVGYEYEEEDSAYLYLYDEDGRVELLNIEVIESNEGQVLTGTDRDFDILQSVFDSYTEDLDDFVSNQNEIEINGYSALWYSGEEVSGSETFGFDCALVSNPNNQCIYTITRIYELDKEHMMVSEFLRFLGSIEFTE